MAGRLEPYPLLPIRIVADYLLFDNMPVSLYSLPPWLADEVREVLRLYRIHKAQQLEQRHGRP